MPGAPMLCEAMNSVSAGGHQEGLELAGGRATQAGQGDRLLEGAEGRVAVTTTGLELRHLQVRFGAVRVGLAGVDQRAGRRGCLVETPEHDLGVYQEHEHVAVVRVLPEHRLEELDGGGGFTQVVGQDASELDLGPGGQRRRGLRVQRLP
jgi:hypothetical protein